MKLSRLWYNMKVMTMMIIKVNKKQGFRPLHLCISKKHWPFNKVYKTRDVDKSLIKLNNMSYCFILKYINIVRRCWYSCFHHEQILKKKIKLNIIILYLNLKNVNISSISSSLKEQITRYSPWCFRLSPEFKYSSASLQVSTFVIDWSLFPGFHAPIVHTILSRQLATFSH